MGDQSEKLKVARETINFCKMLQVNLHLLQLLKNLMCQPPVITSYGEPLTCMMETLPLVMKVRTTTAQDYCCILNFKLLRPGKWGGRGGRGSAVHLLNLFLGRSVKQQAHYVSELVTLVKSPGSRIEMPVAVNLLLSSKCTVT